MGGEREENEKKGEEERGDGVEVVREGVQQWLVDQAWPYFYTLAFEQENIWHRNQPRDNLVSFSHSCLIGSVPNILSSYSSYHGEQRLPLAVNEVMLMFE